MKFYTRISKTYRKDKWPALLSVILAQNLACAKKLGLVDVSAECLIELLALSTSGQKSIGLVTELHDLMTSDAMGMRRKSGIVKSHSIGIDTAGSLLEESLAHTSPLTRHQNAFCVGVSVDEITPLLRCNVQFSTGNTVIGSSDEPVLFQVALSCTNRFIIDAKASVMKACRVLIHFSHPEFNQCFQLVSGDTEISSALLFDSRDGVLSDGYLTTTIAYDDIFRMETCVFQGEIKGTRPLDLSIVKVSIVSESVKELGNSFSLDFNISERRDGFHPLRQRRVWFYKENGRLLRRFMDGLGELSLLRFGELKLRNK
jgi:hypothetical protein